MSEVTFELKDAFSYSHKGDMVEAGFIQLSAPTFKQIDKIAPLKQAFLSAITDMASQAEPSEAASDDHSDITGQQVIVTLYSSKADMSKVFLHAQELFKSGVALVDGEVKLTTPMIEKMSIPDFEGLLGEYLANFTVPSLMGGA